MQYLIDTHILIWYLNGDKKLSQKIKDIIDDDNNIIIISVASIWEMAIKLTQNKQDDFKITLPEIEEHILASQYRLMNISFKHLNSLLALPEYHRDPFDRLLIAQAISENLAIVSVDKHFKAYPIQLIG